MKKILIITLLIAIILVITSFVILNKKTETKPVKPVQTEQVEPKKPVKTKKIITPQKTPVMRDENDMPKSDVNVPEIG